MKKGRIIKILMDALRELTELDAKYLSKEDEAIYHVSSAIHLLEMKE